MSTTLDGVDLLWSLWTELGIPGPYRRHRTAILDPEWLFLVTPTLGARDTRLLDLVRDWCVQHAHRLSSARLAALAAREPTWGTAFLAGVMKPEPLSEDARLMEVPVLRPALLRLRMRGLAGVGGRAEVLVELLHAADRWVTAATFAELGLTKRNAARILMGLEEAGLVCSRWRGNAREVRLVAPEKLPRLVDLSPVCEFPDWRAVFEWVRITGELAALPADKPASFRVEFARRRQELDQLAPCLGVDSGAHLEELEAWAWAQEVTEGLAAGNIPPFKRQ